MTDALKMLPGDIPDKVIGLADEALSTTHYSSDPLDQTVACARAIMAERERCAHIAEQAAAIAADANTRDVDVAMQFAAQNDIALLIADAIRKGEA